MRTYTAFDRFYWEYVSQTWPDAYHEFCVYFSSANIPVELFNDPKHATIQIATLIEFANQSTTPFRARYETHTNRKGYYDIKSDNRNIAGLIYEWFCEYQDQLSNAVTPIFMPSRNANQYLIGEQSFNSASGW